MKKLVGLESEDYSKPQGYSENSGCTLTIPPLPVSPASFHFLKNILPITFIDVHMCIPVGVYINNI